MGESKDENSNDISIFGLNGIEGLNKLFRKKVAENNNEVHMAEFVAMDDETIQAIFEEMNRKPVEVNLNAAHQLSTSKQDLSNIKSQHEYISSKLQSFRVI